MSLNKYGQSHLHFPISVNIVIIIIVKIKFGLFLNLEQPMFYLWRLNMHHSFFDPFLCVTDWFLVYQQTNWHDDKSPFVFAVRIRHIVLLQSCTSIERLLQY